MYALLLSALLAAAAQPTAPVCDILPAYLGPWETPVAAAGAIRPGQAIEVGTGAPLTIEIAEAGSYGVALNIPAWIDVARDARTLESVAHGHGPDCSTIRKIVDFRLEPGSYTITLSRTDATTARILVFRR